MALILVACSCQNNSNIGNEDPVDEGSADAFDDSKYSKGLKFISNGDGTCYVSGIGTCNDAIVLIPPQSPSGDKVTAIGDSAFYLNRKITSVVIPDSVTRIENDAFDGCANVTSFSIPDSVTHIGEAAFANCHSITSFTIPKGITKIEKAIFAYCENLETVVIHKDVTSIVSSAFYSCPSLKAISVAPENECFTDLDGNLYTKDGKTLLIYAIGKTESAFAIPEGVNIIGEDAFNGSESLVSVIIPSSVTEIQNGAFEWCESLASVECQAGLITIGDYAFSYCRSLLEISLPDSVTTIGEKAFGGCDKLCSVEIPASVTHIGESAFGGCDALVNIFVAEQNKNYKDIDGNIYTKDEKVIIQYASGKANREFIIPESVTRIADGAFKGCVNLVTVDIPGGVTSIGYAAFYSCKSLMSIEIPDGITVIEGETFGECDSLTSVTLPKGVTSIGEFAFGWSDSLESIYLPISLTNIGYGAFSGCTLLKDVYYPGSQTDRYTLITIEQGNEIFARATFHYNYVIYVDEIEIIDENCFYKQDGTKYIFLYPDEEGKREYQIVWKLTPENATNSNVDFIYDYMNTNVTVDQNGLVSFSDIGTITVTVMANDGSGKSDSISIYFVQ